MIKDHFPRVGFEDILHIYCLFIFTAHLCSSLLLKIVVSKKVPGRLYDYVQDFIMLVHTINCKY